MTYIELYPYRTSEDECLENSNIDKNLMGGGLLV